MSEKSASLGQMTAGIAHEIKNPLNFVNNDEGEGATFVITTGARVSRRRGLIVRDTLPR